MQRNGNKIAELEKFSSFVRNKKPVIVMHPYLSKIMTYHEIHKLSRSGYSISYISNYLGLNWRSVKKILSIEDDREYESMQGIADTIVYDQDRVFMVMKIKETLF